MQLELDNSWTDVVSKLGLKSKATSSRWHQEKVGVWKSLRSSSHGIVILHVTWMLWMQQNVKKSSSLGVGVHVSFPGRVFFITWDCLAANYFNVYNVWFSCKTPANNAVKVSLSRTLLYWVCRIYVYLWGVDPFSCDSVPQGLYSSLFTLQTNSVAFLQHYGFFRWTSSRNF